MQLGTTLPYVPEAPGSNKSFSTAAEAAPSTASAPSAPSQVLGFHNRCESSVNRLDWHVVSTVNLLNKNSPSSKT